MKFGNRVRFTVNNELLKDYEIAGEVEQLSKMFDIIRDKSNPTCISDLLADIQNSIGNDH